VFSYVFMKILEQRPRSYDRKMEKTSKGRVKVIKQAVAAEVLPGMRVLEIGCGTGELAAMLVSKGATVHGFDLSAAMIQVASERIASEGLHDKLAVRQAGVEYMDGLPDKTYDAVVSTLVFSEFSDDERRFALRQAFRVLKPGGILVIADEVVPRTRGRRWLQALVRGPALAATYLISRSFSRPLADLPRDVAAEGFSVEKEARSHGDAFEILVARRTISGAEK
jgi:ubiquinone/menaquinone biosynthesis C-methylase UbiE